MGGTVRTPREIRLSISRLAGQGADVIKVMASGGGTPGTSAGRAAFPLKMLRLMRDEAHRLGLPIVAHATCPEAVRDALIAGFDGIEHAGFWTGEDLRNGFDPAVAELMQRDSVFIAPTLQASYRTLHELPGQTAEQIRHRRNLVDDAASNFKQMLRYDIQFVAGTDAGYMLNPFGDLWLGLSLMVQAGMPERDALAAATLLPARALGLESVIGRISPGYEADLVVLGGDPIADISSCRQVRAVYRAGHPIHVEA